MAPPTKKPVADAEHALAGPRTPEWSCSQRIGMNWRCRTRCRLCKRSALQSIIVAAKAAPKRAEEQGEASPKGPNGPTEQDKVMKAKLEKTQKELKQNHTAAASAIAATLPDGLAVTAAKAIQPVRSR